MSTEGNAVSFTEQGMPTHQHLVIPVVRAVGELGGSAKAREITDQVLDTYPDVERLLEMTYTTRPNQSVLIDRIAWGRSTAKLIGALEQPSKGMYITTDLGEELLAVSEDEALRRIRDLDREYNRQQRRKRSPNPVHRALEKRMKKNLPRRFSLRQTLRTMTPLRRGRFSFWIACTVSRRRASRSSSSISCAVMG